MSAAQVAEPIAAHERQTAGESVFVSSFDLLATAPEGVARLRELILLLAMHGKLVPQAPDDEPASALLDRIRTEKSRLIALGKIKRGKPLPHVKDHEKLFRIPPGWSWVRMNHISNHRLGKMLDKAKNTGKLYPYLRNTNVQWGRIDSDDLKEIRLEDHEVDEYKLAAGDLLICEGGYPGRCAIWRESNREMYFQKALHRVRPLGGVLAEYLEICLRADSNSRVLEQYFTGATIKHFAGQELNRYVLPLPPLAEQARIVARVEELMQLCDALEAHSRLQDEQHARLVTTLFDALAASETAHALAENWHRISSHFDLLLDRPDAVDTLEQTILQLAVRGLLVPQDPADETSEDLLRRIRGQRAELLGRKSNGHAVPPDIEGEVPFQLPKSWLWVEWRAVALQIGDIDHKMPQEASDGYPYVSPKDFVSDGGIDFAGAKKISASDFEQLSSKIKPERGDLIYPRYGTIGNVRLVETDEPFLASYSCAVIKCMNGFIDRKYQFFVSISSLIAIQAAAATNKTTQPNVGLKSIQSFLFPLPPLAEQHRIVARVEQLRRLCADLRERLKQARATQAQLADALVSATAQSPAC